MPNLSDFVNKDESEWKPSQISVACSTCGSNETECYRKDKEIRVHCVDCGLIYVIQMPWLP